MRCSLVSRGGVGSACATLLRRFVPPWEKEGKTADDFFGDVMQSGNPILRKRKEDRQQEEARDAAVVGSPSPVELARAEEQERRVVEEEQRLRDFLPYGATPKEYAAESGMAAWGEYRAHLESGCGYSDEARQLLLRDMEDKLPYRYTEFRAPAKDASGCPVPQWPLHGTAGVVMDIDGVVYRSHRLLPGSDTGIRTLRELRIPFVFMTNGGGMSEADKAAELSALLGVPIAAEEVLLAHTPMQLLAPRYADEPVLIVGRGRSAEVARGYGFHRAIGVEEFQCAHPEMTPFKRFAGLPALPPGAVPFPPIAAVLQFTDPADAFNDIQTVLDVLTAPGGRVGARVAGAQSVPLYVSGDDLLWATEAALPRLGQGAFREMLSSVYEAVTGQRLETVMYGKPRRIAYAFAEQRVRALAAAQGWDPRAMRAIFMVGDNLETDIIGANAAGGAWTSVHVLSGIGSAPSAQRTLNAGDEEQVWLERSPPRAPHYVAPTLDHFIRELLAFPEAALTQNRQPYYGVPNPVDLQELYHFTPPA